MPRPGIAAQGGKMILETPRLILRPFAADDLDRMAELMANKDFMRFSMGPMTQEHEEFPR
jgi:RimJ/RimL family protein N-acetyltransferase